MAKTRISDSDLASVALYDKVNQMISETEDTVTIETSASGYNQVIGVLEKNHGGVRYVWIGTAAEYAEQNIEELHPEWVCYITDQNDIPKIEYLD